MPTGTLIPLAVCLALISLSGTASRRPTAHKFIRGRAQTCSLPSRVPKVDIGILIPHQPWTAGSVTAKGRLCGGAVA
jgi:hypothetical protein